MSDTPLPPPVQLPARPSLEQLRKLAKRRLVELRADDPSATLAAAQHALARAYGFASWPRLVDHVGARDTVGAAPTIVAPVARHLGARDVAATARFWCEVLGFAVDDAGAPEAGVAAGTVTLVAGEARIHLHREDWAPDYSGGPQPPGTAIVFLQVSDVGAMHAAVAARGGRPSALEKVNGLKLQLFEVRDPDGHVVWCGQSYQRDMPPRPARMLVQALPELPCHDVPAAVRHYREVLGFSVNYAQHDLGVMDRDQARLLLIAPAEAAAQSRAGTGSACFYVRDADDLYAELLQAGADVEGEPVSRPWGMREFVARDLDGNRLTFAQTFE